MGIDVGDVRENPWGITPATASMTGGSVDGAVLWPPPSGTMPPPAAGSGSGLDHPRVMSRVSLGF